MAKNPYVAQLRRTLRGTPMAPYAQLIARVEARNKLPKGLLAGIAKAESSFGTAGRSGHQTNPFGWMSAGGPAVGLMPFPNLGAAIRHVGSTLGERGWRDPAKFGSTYVGESTWQQNWLPNVRSVMSQMGSGVPTPPPRGAGNPPRGRPAPDANRKKEVLGLLFQLMAARQSGVSTSALIPLVLSMAGDRTPLGPKGSQPERNTRIPVDSTERSVVSVAREFLLSDRKETYSMGSPYGRSIYPTNTRDVKSFDCSSFIQYVYWKATGKKLDPSGRANTETLWARGKKVSTNALAVGDAVFFGGRGGVPVAGGSSHVGMYIGNGKFIHSSSSGQVKVSDLSSYGRSPIGARRYL